MNEASSDSPNDSSQTASNLPVMGGHRREAFFGLIAPLGVDLEAVVLALSRALANVGYAANEIKLTGIFDKYPHWYDTKFSNQAEKYNKYIAAGDKLREDAGRDDILALYSVARLNDYSDRDLQKPVPQNVIHIFRQIKRVEEINVYKEIFGRNILLIACYAARELRVQFLVKQMLKTERGVLGTSLESRALEIIARDEDERDEAHGQRMMQCYPHADYVLDCTTHQTLTNSAERLIEIYFGAPFISPTRDEYASYIANAASYRSLDLSRQVGAAIFGPDCDVIALGCNEVPKAGGGTYWAGTDDHRDYAIGYDSNQKVRDDMTRDALVRLQRNAWFNDRLSTLSPDELVAEAFDASSDGEPPLRDAMLRDVIEYGRMVHAEMNALADAARFRRSTVGATLYCTTMPCHMCAKLILAAGIQRVVYIQPYTKSLVSELFSDSVAIDDPSPGFKVQFDSLKGVTPNGFRIAFRKTQKRKESDGKAVTWETNEAKPTFLSTFAYYQPLEAKAVIEFERAARAVEELHPEQREMNLKVRSRRRSSEGKAGSNPKRRTDGRKKRGAPREEPR